MPELLPGDKPKWTRQYVSPALDFVLREEVTNEQADKLVPGQAHPQGKYTGYVFCGLKPANEKGQYAYYAKTRAAQEAYNYHNAEVLSNEWPEVRQTWVLTRAAYAAAGHAQQTAPPALGGRTWTFMDSVQRRMPPEFDAIFVEVEHVWRDISTGRTDSVVDMETGQLRSEEKRIVAAGTVGQAVDAGGTYKNVQALNRLWSLQRTLQVAGLAGGGTGATRSWTDVINYSWPDVLLGLDLYALPAADGSIKKIAHRPIWLREAYSGPCAATITETWTKNPPVPPVITPMLEGEVWFDGAILQVPRLRCLHPAMVFYEAPGSTHPELGNYLYSQSFEATALTDWPATHVADYKVTPAFGGYLSRLVEVIRPTGSLFANMLQLTGEPDGVNAWGLSWSRLNPVGALTRYRVDINLKPDFSGSYLSGWKNKDMGTAVTAAVSGLVPGLVYYARVKAEIAAQPQAVSNIILMAAEGQPEITVELGTPLADGEEIDFGETGESVPVVETLTIRNTGNVEVTGLARALDGTDAADWTAAALGASTLAAGATLTFDLTLDAATAGVKDALLLVTSDNAPDLSFPLSAEVFLAQLYVEHPEGTDVTGGGPVTFAPMEEKAFTLRNRSGSTITFSSILLSGDTEFEFVGGTPADVAAGATATVTVKLNAGSSGFLATLFIASDAPNTPINISLQ